MRKLLFPAVVAISMLAGEASAEESPVIGVVNFATCVTDSKAGKKEQENLENMRQQMGMQMEQTEKELKEIAAKFDDPDYLDSLSPKAEEELKARFQGLQEDHMRYQNQFYQVLNHANYQMMQKINSTIAKAAETVASQKNLDYVMNKEACFYIRPDLDVTSTVIDEMDKNFELDAKAQSLTETGENLQNNLENQEAKGG